VKKQKSSEEAPEIETTTKEFTEEKINEMMQLVQVEDVYVQALQVKHPIIDWKVHSEEWKLYDLSRVHHVTAKDKEIFMLVEKDYPLRRGLALVMISYRLQVENYSQMAEDLLRKIYNIANTPRKQNANHVGCIDSCKSTSRRNQFLGDKLVSWMSKKQNCTAMSSVEAKYVVLSASCAQVMWMRTQLQDYGFNYNKIPLYCDSQSAIAHATPYSTPVPSTSILDMFTKALPKDRFKYLVRRIGMRCLTPAELEVLAKESA
nr:hypothetical protein [Tanacetum cinerariifolium]